MSANSTESRDRKAEHIRLALDERMQLVQHHFEAYRFDHEALPEIDLDEIDTTTEFLGKPLAAPLLISCMTGGTEEATRINRNLARAAQSRGIAVGVGSQRKALEDPGTIESFRIRPFAPGVPLLANLGAVQLNYGFGLEECRRAVEMIEADALVLHLNPLQEAIREVLFLMLGTVFLGAVATAIGAGWLAQTSVMPVLEITAQARSVQPGVPRRITAHADTQEFAGLVDVLNDAFERLERAFDAQRRMITDAAHDLRTPLTAMRGEAEIALRGERTPDEYRHTLQSMLEEVDQLTVPT